MLSMIKNYIDGILSTGSEKATLYDILGIKGVYNGMIITTDGYVGLFEVKPINFDLRSQMEKTAVLEKFEALNRRLKTPYQVFTIARHADPKAHIELMLRNLETEKNENVRALLREYIDYLNECSRNTALNKRYIVAIPYRANHGSVSAEDAFTFINEKLYAFQSAVSECGNECIGISDMTVKERSRFVAEILSSMININ